MKFNFIPRFIFALGLSASLAACNLPPEDPDARAEYYEINDPLEPMNRAFFELNRGLDTILFKPLAKAYLLLPEDGRDIIHNMINNIKTPVTLGNDIFQLERERIGNTLGRFLINTTLGIGGMFDVATHLGLPYHEEDFGQTLAVWGSPSGPYLVLPIFGPSNPRDLAGSVVDAYMDPLGYLFAGDEDRLFSEYSLIRSAVQGIDERSRVMDVLDELEENSIDFYATIRSLNRQRRAEEISNGTLSKNVPGPSFMTENEDGTSNRASLTE